MSASPPESPNYYADSVPPSQYPPMNRAAPEGTNEPYPGPPVKKRANRDALAIAGAIGAVVWLVGYIASPLRADHNSAFVAGSAMATALIASLPVALAARSSTTRWPLWRYVALIVPIAVGLTVLRTVNESADSGPVQASGTAATGTAATVTADRLLDVDRRTATAPAAVGPWTRDDSPAAQAHVQTATDEWQSRAGADGDTMEIAVYRNGGQQAVLLVVTARPGSDLDQDTSDSPSQGVVNALAGAGVEERSMADPGPLGGALGCGPSTKGNQVYICAWVELGMLGTVSFVDAGLTADSAAAVTREFRQGTEH